MAYETLGWATNELDGDGNPTKIVPPQEVQLTGLLTNEPMGRQWFNHIIHTLIRNTDAGAVPVAQATHAVRVFGAAQPDLIEANGWKLINTVPLAAASGGNLYYYEHVGVTTVTP
ncbi:hypothetical protein Arno162_97 [Pectobacterium phage Arno162]|uniref:Uncharacterized protein n=1 Tax=Pectobacterium phage Arno162 TaxID=2500577 RepID=A0A678ZZA6_9CAUD|nr:hypothetical protein Arno162_97 [Pectobacterium phage Arno162]